MPKMQDAHIDRAMTNISVAYMQDASTFIADKVFPIIPVRRQSDIYYQYDRADFNRDEAQVRAAATESAGGDYGVEAQNPYFCRKYSFHKDITPEERANYDEPLNADQDATAFVSQKMLIRRENHWAATFFKTGIWGTDKVGTTNFVKLDATTSDPIGLFTKDGVTMAENTGFRPNTLVLSPYVYNTLMNHEDILDRIKYTQKGVATTDLLAQLFNVDRVLVPWGIVNAAAKGATEANSFIFGKNALLCHSAGRPALRTPTAGYIFAWTGLEGSGAYGNRIIRIPMDILGLGVERIEGECAFDAKIICADLGIFYKDVVS